MLSWHNDPALKAEVVERMREHRRQDQIIQGTYQQWEGFAGHKGCFIGCTLPYISAKVRESENWLGFHQEVEDRYGIPWDLVHAMEQIFEGLPSGQHKDYALRLVELIPVGVDLEPLFRDFREKFEYSFQLRSVRGEAERGRDYLFWLLRGATPVPEPAPPLIQHIDIPEPEPILIRTVVNN